MTGNLYDEEKYEAAFQAALQMKKKDYPSYIGGMKIASGNEFIIRSPIDNSISFGSFQEPEDGITDRAVDVALKLHTQWVKASPEERVSYFEIALETIKAQKYRLAAVILLSSGMTRSESVKEVDTLIDILAAECKRSKQGVKGKTGAWGIITSYNSPLASPIGHAVAAMLAGNTVVVMPSRYCPAPVYMVYDILEKAGLPSGVMNLVIDRKDRSYEQLANDPRLEGILISGSASYMEEMLFLQVDDELKVLNEAKGMNPIIIHRPGNINEVVEHVMDSAFKYSGQGLFSTSKVIITSEDSNKFINALLEKVKDLKISDPADQDTFAGPLISDINAKMFADKIDDVRNNVLYGGKRVVDELTQNGQYYTPAIITGLDDDNELMYMDFGMPVLSIKTVNGIDEAFEELANTECGLSAGIMSKDQKAVDKFRAECDTKFKFINESSGSLVPAVYARTEEFLK